MADVPSGPTADRVVFVFCESTALALAFGFVEQLLAGKSYWIVASLIVASIAFSYIGFTWPKIKAKVNSAWLRQLDAFANDYRYRYSLVILLIGFLLFYVIGSMRDLRSDLDLYVIPRHLTEDQRLKLKELFSKEAHSITIKSDPNDQEANQYAIQFEEVFRQAGWQVMDSNDVGRPCAVGYDIGICESGFNDNADRSHGLTQMVQISLYEGAYIHAGTSGEGQGENKVFLVIGHRPQKLRETTEAFRTRLARWIENL